MWDKIKAFFSGSETIFWARVQMALGVLAGAIVYFDPQLLTPIMPADWLPWVVVVNGIATEYLRRRRAGDLG